MVKNKKTKKTAEIDMLPIKRHIRTFAVNFIIYIAMLFIAVLISFALGTKASQIYTVSLLSFAVSSLICGFLAAFKQRKNGIQAGIISVIPEAVLFLLISLAFNRLKADALQVAVTTAVMLLSGVIGGILGVNTRLKPKKKRGK